MDRLHLLLDYILMMRQCPYNEITLMGDARREELKGMWVARYDKYGRNFINYLRALLNNERWFDFDPPDNTYLATPSKQNELARFIGMTLERNESFMSVLYQKLIDDADVLLAEQERVAEQLGTVEERDDYYAWSHQIEKTCRELNDKYPEFFRNRLHEFLAIAHKHLIEDNKRKPDPVPQTQKVEEEENKVVNWEELIQQVIDYKFNHNVGYMYGVLQHWLDNMADGMKASLSHTFPRYYPEQVKSFKLAEMEKIEAARANIKMFDADIEEPQVKKMKMSPVNFVMKPFPNFTNGFSNMPKKPAKCSLHFSTTFRHLS